MKAGERLGWGRRRITGRGASISRGEARALRPRARMLPSPKAEVIHEGAVVSRGRDHRSWGLWVAGGLEEDPWRWRGVRAEAVAANGGGAGKAPGGMLREKEAVLLRETC